VVAWPRMRRRATAVARVKSRWRLPDSRERSSARALTLAQVAGGERAEEGSLAWRSMV
jgi:hypothetical protein